MRVGDDLIGRRINSKGRSGDKGRWGTETPQGVILAVAINPDGNWTLIVEDPDGFLTEFHPFWNEKRFRCRLDSVPPS